MTRRRVRLNRTTKVATALTVLGVAAYGLYFVHERSQTRWQAPGGRLYEGTLTARVVGDSGSPIVLLHGMLGSKSYWGASYDRLAEDHRLVVPDLLGFGDSPKPRSGYTADDHATAVLALLDELGVTEPALLVGHSLGALVALRIAAVSPERTSAVVGFAPPLYSTPEVAKRRVAGTDPMGGLLTLDNATARRVCIAFHRHPRIFGLLAQLLRPRLPGEVAREAARHTWESYWGTMSQVVLSAEGANWVAQGKAPLRFVIGDADEVVEPSFLEALVERTPRATLRVVAGADHELPLTRPDLCLREIRAAAETR